MNEKIRKTNIHICNFSGGVAYLTRRQKKEPLMVLQILAKNPWVSTFDMNEGKLYKTIDVLIDEGWIKY